MSEKNTKTTEAFIVVKTKRKYPITIDDRLPIYWHQKRAKEVAAEHNADVERCFIDIPYHD